LQIDKLYLEGESSKIHLFPAPHFHEDKFREDRAITKDKGYLQSLDNQAKVHDLENTLNSLSIISTTSRQRRLQLWRGKVNYKGRLKI